MGISSQRPSRTVEESSAHGEIVLLVAAMIAAGKPGYDESSVATMVRQAVNARHWVHKYADRILADLATKEAKEAAAIAAAEKNVGGGR